MLSKEAKKWRGKQGTRELRDFPLSESKTLHLLPAILMSETTHPPLVP